MCLERCRDSFGRRRQATVVGSVDAQFDEDGAQSVLPVLLAGWNVLVGTLTTVGLSSMIKAAGWCFNQMP
jgi:hypothetical protein